MYQATIAFTLLLGTSVVSGFTPVVKSTRKSAILMASTSDETLGVISRRSAFATTASAASMFGLLNSAAFADDENVVESIAARAARMAKEVEAAEKDAAPVVTSARVQDTRTIYDFSVPVANKDVPFVELIDQIFPSASPPVVSEGDESTLAVEPTKGRARVKAILVVNIKQDDPIARKNIPELITLASKYGKDFAVVAVPTDQGYYEPDTSALIRLKLDREYGYGINPATHVTDKMNLLGTGAHPMMRWVEGTCRTPQGLGRIQGNFEKFLIDGDTGKPVRRYPRKYSPYDIKDDIQALIDGKALPPAGSNYLEQWREAAADAERDTYRFQKGLNVFDQ